MNTAVGSTIHFNVAECSYFKSLSKLYALRYVYKVLNIKQLTSQRESINVMWVWVVVSTELLVELRKVCPIGEL